MSNAARKLESDHKESGLNLQHQDWVEVLQKGPMLAEFTPEGVVTEVNERFLKQLKFQDSFIKGLHHKEICSVELTQSEEYKKFWSELAEGKEKIVEFKRKNGDDREIWLHASYFPILNPSGKVIKVLEFSIDVSLSGQELEVRKEIMNLTSIVSEANLRGDIMTVNDKFVEVSKYSREELLGKPHNITRHPDMPKEVFKELWSTIGRGKMFRGMIKNLAKDGNPYYVDAVIAPLLGENGKPRKYLGVRYDITEAEIERQNMMGVLGAIDTSFAYIEFDTDGNILSANKNFELAMGFSAEEIKGKHHRMFCEEDFVRSAEYARFWPELKSGKSKSGAFRRKTRTGKEIWLQAVYAPVMDETGRVIKVVKIATDVTEQQQMITSIQETASTLSGASSELMATATEMSSTAGKTSKESDGAAKAAEQVATGVQVVAANVGEMVASIKEIGRSTNESSQMAKMTLEKAQESNATILKLGVSSQEIGDVIKVISSIAQQTNLLALNATIEAARAGEAGKGFAVVANEVKELAKQTAKATDDITHKIGAIQSDTKSAVEAISGISQSVEKLNGISGVIASAVEEQTATTNEISRVVTDSQRGVESIADTIKTVSMAAQENTVNSSQTLDAAKELARLAETLSALVANAKK